MRSIIQNYANEGKGEDGHPNGKFYLNYPEANEAAEEIVRTHLHLDGEKNAEFRAKRLQ